MSIKKQAGAEKIAPGGNWSGTLLETYIRSVHWEWQQPSQALPKPNSRQWEVLAIIVRYVYMVWRPSFIKGCVYF
ncbi:MAG: hypothetical protein FWF69_05995 [Firmicutes bacterium]|nr:hypothetical protein [Bacillota bacterium]